MIVKIISYIFTVLIIILSIYILNKELPMPIRIDTQCSITRRALESLEAPHKDIDELTIAINNVAKITNISPILLCALIYTESSFDQKAVSSKNYKGLMQTPWASMRWADVDILIGAKILEEKLVYSKGDLELALALYKGGNNPLAKKYATETLSIYKELQRKLL